jgi:hypothetical protein
MLEWMNCTLGRSSNSRQLAQRSLGTRTSPIAAMRGRSRSRRGHLPGRPEGARGHHHDCARPRQHQHDAGGLHAGGAGGYGSLAATPLIGRRAVGCKTAAKAVGFDSPPGPPARFRVRTTPVQATSHPSDCSGWRTGCCIRVAWPCRRSEEPTVPAPTAALHGEGQCEVGATASPCARILRSRRRRVSAHRVLRVASLGD